jgi:hypothetical protein
MCGLVLRSDSSCRAQQIARSCRTFSGGQKIFRLRLAKCHYSNRRIRKYSDSRWHALQSTTLAQIADSVFNHVGGEV